MKHLAVVNLKKSFLKEINKPIAFIVFIYLIFSFVALPLISPLRNLGVIEPALIRNALLPPLFLLLIFSVGIKNILKPKAGIQLLLLLMFIQSAIIGLVNVFEGSSFRSYFSHLFQVASAYLLFCAGWLLFDYWGERFWRPVVLMGFFSAIISTYFTISALDRGDIGRYYTAAYGFILISSFSAVHSRKLLFLSFVVTFISNKRAVFLSVITIIASVFSNIGKDPNRKLKFDNLIKSSIAILVGTTALLLLIFILIDWSEENPESGIAKAVNISVGRLEQVFDARRNSQTIDQISSGRIHEIRTTMQSLDGFDIIFGSGAGWNVTIDSERSAQNIHFTPLSLVAVYGAPYSIFLYAFLLFYLIRFYLKGRPLSTTERMAPFYVVGALVHSFFAYSLFIDWMFFFFVGVLARVGLQKKRDGLRQ